MSYSIEALAMAGVDYNEWGMDLEEWERIENGPPLPHLYAEEFEVHECEEEETYEVRMTKDVYDKREKDSDDDSVMPRLLAHDKSVNRPLRILFEQRITAIKGYRGGSGG
nr:tetratricopeptide-like helical [Tanacetum cinerariifolium]